MSFVQRADVMLEVAHPLDVQLRSHYTARPVSSISSIHDPPFCRLLVLGIP